MLIDIPSEVAMRLQAMADEQGCSVGDLLRDWLAPENAEPRYATLADMARNARAANLGKGKPVDTSTRSREILKAEFPDYIRRNSTT